ncbi:hypothetical protein BGW80DRAFT_1348369, partial [Lactifluus volemus]
MPPRPLWGLKSFFTLTKTGAGVLDAFAYIAQRVVSSTVGLDQTMSQITQKKTFRSSFCSS